MTKVRYFLKKAFTPITIMIVPHANVRSLNLKVPSVGIIILLFLSVVGAFRVGSLALDGLQYHSMADKVEYYSGQFSQWNSTVTALKEIEGDFRRLFSLKSKETILEKVDTHFTGSVDIPSLMQEIQKTVEAVAEVKDYLRTQKDIYLATPKGYPVMGSISSTYGKRENPFSGENVFHSGVDIPASPGTSIRATADGVVSFSGWNQNSGHVIVLEHGLGFTTIYAHNQKNAVKVSERVKRGDAIGYVGSTGKSTGPHVHYEVWKNGKNTSPLKYLQGRS